MPLQYHLMTAEGVERTGDAWKIKPPLLLRSLVERRSGIMMPMTGDAVELRLPDGQAISASIVSFGVEAWKDDDGNLYTRSDPANPSLTLTITCDSDLTNLPSGTEVWLPNARTESAARPQ
jgi:hypothetical protein